MDLKEALEGVELEFRNRDVEVKILKSLENVRVLGEFIKAYEPGSEVKLKRWIASKLVDEGFAAFKQGEEMTMDELVKIHWKEGLQPSSRLSGLPEDFYQRLRSYLRRVKQESESTGNLQLLEKSIRLARDIVNVRTRKIVSMAVSLSVPQELLQPLTAEERLLYDELKRIIEFWRSYFLKPVEGV